MNFLEILKNKLNYNNIELAYQLFNTLGVGANINSKYSKRVHEIERECTDYNLSPYPDRQKILLKVIELAGNPDTPKQRYILAMAYAWSKVKYREQAINYLELYLNNDLYDEIYIHKNHFYNSNIEVERKYHLLEMYDYLCKAYIGIYDFDKALEVAEKMIEIFPENPTGYNKKVEIMHKQNRLQECKEWLEKVKKSKYYKKYTYTTFTINGEKKATSDWLYKTINNLDDLTNDRIKNNYIYKPRKK